MDPGLGVGDPDLTEGDDEWCPLYAGVVDLGVEDLTVDDEDLTADDEEEGLPL